MAIDVKFGSNYRDPSNTIQRQEIKTTAYEANANTENTSGAKAGSNNQIGKDQENGSKEQRFSDKQIRDAISRANNQIRNHRTKFEFNYHEETKRVSIKVIDKETEEVLKEIPPEETLEMMEKIWELAGLLIDEKR